MNPRNDAEVIFRAAINCVDPKQMIERALSVKTGSLGDELVVRTEFEEVHIPIEVGGRVFVTGMGKATARMAAGLERALGSHLSGGYIAVKEGYVERLDTIDIVETGHPVPDERSVSAAKAILNLDSLLGITLSEHDLVIVLVSGGGSAILCAPAEGLSLADKVLTTKLLLASGATINEINCVRKHLSAVKGGRLAAAFAPARILSLILSDVIGDDLDSIASGPTVPDPTRYADALAIVRHYGLEGRLSMSVVAHLMRGNDGLLEETPKPGDAIFDRARTILVGTNRLALVAAQAQAHILGYNSLILSSRITGEARELALAYLGIGKDIEASGFPVKRPACVIAGGETTVTLRGNGRGGRNQEMALAFLAALGRSPKDAESVMFFSAGTDGNDGPTDAAGALADMALYRKARMLGLDPEAALDENDSYGFFTAAGGLVKTGPTNTNVCDIQLLLVP